MARYASAVAASKKTGSFSKIQRLQRRVRTLPPALRDDRFGRIEVHQQRVRRRPLEVDIQSAAITVVAFAFLPAIVAFGAVREGRHTGRLRRLHALSTHVQRQQSACIQGRIADQFGRKSQPGLAAPAARYRDLSTGCPAGLSSFAGTWKT